MLVRVHHLGGPARRLGERRQALLAQVGAIRVARAPVLERAQPQAATAGVAQALHRALVHTHVAANRLLGPCFGIASAGIQGDFDRAGGCSLEVHRAPRQPSHPVPPTVNS